MPPNGALGGVETPMAYADGVVYVPVVNSAMNWTPTSLDFSSFNLTAGTGELVAIDVNTGEKLWDNRLDAVNVGSAMVVNDLVFTATFDGTIYAFNCTDGAQLWTYKAPSTINGWPAIAGNTIVWPAGRRQCDPDPDPGGAHDHDNFAPGRDIRDPRERDGDSDASASTTIFKGAIMTGPATTTYTFTAPSTPGTYFFRCDVHPTVMTGQFIVQ